jgi:hypothetical protein
MADSREILVALTSEYDRDTDPAAGRDWRLFFHFFERRADDVRAECKDGDAGQRTLHVYSREPGYYEENALKAAKESQDPTYDLVQVAHELGHHLLWLGGKLPERVGRPPQNVYSEEILAWAIGKHILAARGFGEWRRFGEVRDFSLETYRSGLRLDHGEAKAIEAGLFGTSL